MWQETDKFMQLDRHCSSNITHHGSFWLKDQIAAGTETGGMDPSNTTESWDGLSRSGDTTGTKSKNLFLPNVNSECDDMCCMLICQKFPNVQQRTPLLGWRKGMTNNQVLFCTGSPLRRSVRLNNTISFLKKILYLLTESLQQRTHITKVDEADSMEES
jgi:hypothetical protein